MFLHNKYEDLHPLFLGFNFDNFYEKFKILRTIKRQQPLILVTDHTVDDDFFWALSRLLVECHKLDPTLPNEPIVAVPPSTDEDEFLTLLTKVRKGTVMIDHSTFEKLALNNKSPAFFFNDRLMVYRDGETNFIPSAKYNKA